jgi:hypothetical protein
MIKKMLLTAALLLLPSSFAMAQSAPYPLMTDIRKLVHGIDAACSCTVVRLSGNDLSPWPDVSKWIITYAPGTTDAQKALGQAFLQSYSPSK